MHELTDNYTKKKRDTPLQRNGSTLIHVMKTPGIPVMGLKATRAGLHAVGVGVCAVVFATGPPVTPILVRMTSPSRTRRVEVRATFHRVIVGV
jgi:hypothetical protein